MKKFITVLFFISINAYSQNPTYTLDATNFAIYNNYMEWDIYLSHTNPPVTFEYSGGQYFFGFNPLIANGGISNLRYKIVAGSDLPGSMQPRGPSISTATNPAQTVLRLAVNAFQGCGNGYIMTNNGVPGTRIIRVRLETIDSSDFVSGQSLDLVWRNPPTVAFTTKIFVYDNNCVNTDITTPSTHLINGIANTAIKFNMTVLMEGMYNNLFNLMNRKDPVKVYLRNASSPYLAVDSASGNIDSVSFTNLFSFPNAGTGTYYIVVNHFNSIETWSKAGGEVLNIATVGNYNFTTAASQAFGSNMKLKGSKYTMFSGDVNKDGIIDGTDLSAIDNDAHFFVTGYRIATDLNGDNVVDGFDFLIGDNNRRYVTVITP